MTKIIIMGAGISGLVSGILLKQHGFQVEIHEKRKEIASIGGGIGFWPIGSKILLQLPCAEKILNLAGKPKYTHIGDAEGNTLATNPEDFLLQINGSPMLHVCRSELQQVLLEEFGAENIKFNSQCCDIHQDEQQVNLDFVNGLTAAADLVIAADGVHSIARRIFFPETNPEYAGYVQLVGIFQIPNDSSWKHHFIWGKNRYCITLPISDGRYMHYHIRPLEYKTLQQYTQKEQINLFRGWSTEVDWLLDQFQKSLEQSKFSSHYFCGEAYSMAPLSTWHQNRVALLGDAAHPIGSILALGASSSLEDCYVLVNALTQYESYSKALAVYETQQIPRSLSFLEAEKSVTNILMYADETQYQQFIHEIKLPNPKKSSFFELLKYSDSTILSRNNCCEAV